MKRSFLIPLLLLTVLAAPACKQNAGPKDPYEAKGLIPPLSEKEIQDRMAEEPAMTEELATPEVEPVGSESLQ